MLTKRENIVSSRVDQPFSRRELLCRTWNGIGTLALAGMLAGETNAATLNTNPLAVKPQHLPRKAKHCIFLFMAGGGSQIDNFFFQPSFQKKAGQRPPQKSGLSRERESCLEPPHSPSPRPLVFI